jgi:hypothetical protein
MDGKFRVTISLLLTGILVMLVAIYFKIPNAPPTLGEFRTAKGKAKAALYMKLPLIHVDGRVDIGNTPLEVEVSNIPLEVEISR